MSIDVAIILFLVLCFFVGRKITIFFYRFISNKRSKSVIVLVTKKDGSKLQYVLTQKEADELIKVAIDNPHQE